MKRGRLVAVVGPTAVGKTSMAIGLAEHFSTEVVSADSRQVFREMEIGTAKPTARQLARVRHHFVNTRSIAEGYDAGTYADEALDVLQDLFRKRDYVILCGGSGLYIKALLEGFDDFPDVPAVVREQVIADYNRSGLEGLQEELRGEDPDYYEAVDQKNPQRLMRAIEVIRHTARPFSAFHSKAKRELPFDVVKIGLDLDRKELYRRIESRMADMIRCGLFEEAKCLFPQRKHAALQTVGYQEIFGFILGEYDRNQAIHLLNRNSRRYAKRQLTWFRRDKDIRWFLPDDWQGIIKYCTAGPS